MGRREIGPLGWSEVGEICRRPVDGRRLVSHSGREDTCPQPCRTCLRHVHQGSLPADGIPLAFILYADKTQLSSFGTEKGYPVYAKLANLPTEVRNGAGLGGGRFVGWLPVVSY